MTDKEVEEGAKIVLTPRDLLIERCARFLRLEELEAPTMVLDGERKLIQRAVAECTPDDIAYAMRDFPSAVARLRRIAAEVEAENPVYPELEDE